MKDQPPEGPPSADPAPDYGYGGPDSSPAAPGGSTPALGQPTSPTGTRVARMRPVPEEFPTPPPRPTGWNRRQAPDVTTAGTTSRRRPIVVVAVAAIIVLAAVVVLGGGFLLLRVASGAGQDPAPGTSQPSEAAEDESPGSSDGGTVGLGDVSVSVASVEEGVAEVGPVSTRESAQGEFVILTLDLENGSEQNIAVGDSVVLVTDDGTVISSDQQATTQHVAESDPAFTFIGPGETATVHVVFDVPPGTVLDHASIDLDRYPGAGSGDLDLG